MTQPEITTPVVTPAAGGALLSVRGLVKQFQMKAVRGMTGRKRVVQAVSDVSFDVAPGETLGLVGE